ncbi:MAG: TetR/AcrR family transcriptional regulator [Spirochaetaceae bacterium]|jgi:TetR/AcrR family transcriptional regulator|nr:TetR/AcrR family transcriptional regulator [Spirochaetaceae bacterium]
MDETGDTGGTKDRILTVSLHIFSRRGYESTGVQEIAGEAGITKPTLYYYFGSKQGLLEAILSRYGAALIELFRKAGEYRHDLGANLTDLFQDTLDYALDHEDFFRLIRAIFSAAPETAAYTTGRGLRRELIALLERLFTEAAGDHGNMKNRQMVYAETFMGLLETWALNAVNGEIRITNQLRYRIIHNYMHGIFS